MNARLTGWAELARGLTLPRLTHAAVTLLGALCWLASLGLPWFALPGPRTAAAAARAGPLIVGLETPCTLLWKLALLAAGAAGCALAWKRPAGRRATCSLTASLSLACLLFYPGSLLYLAPGAVARANWLAVQHRNLAWLGGDVFASSESKSVDRKLDVTIVDVPRQIGAVKIPKSIPYLLNLAQLGETVEWLGYSDAFCYLVGKGWLCAVAGAILLLSSALRAEDGLDYRRLRQALKAFGAVTVAWLALALLPVFLTAHAIGCAHEALELGNYIGAHAWLRTAGACTPIIRQNSYYIIQDGLIDDQLGRDTAAAAYYRSVRLETAGFTAQAQNAFAELVTQSRADPALHREILRGLLRAAIRDLNSGQLEQSVTLLESILREDPACLKANYCLQLASLRLDRFDRLGELLAQMRQIYGFFGTITKVPVLASCQENEAQALFLHGDLAGALTTKLASP